MNDQLTKRERIEILEDAVEAASDVTADHCDNIDELMADLDDAYSLIYELERKYEVVLDHVNQLAMEINNKNYRKVA